MQSIPKKFNRFPTFTTLSISLLVYSGSWLVTYLISHLVWQGSLPNSNSTTNLLDFILPLIIIAGVIIWANDKKKNFQILPFLFILIGVIVLLNITLFHFTTMNYGDNGQLSQEVQKGQVLPRWMLGASILKSVFQSIWFPLAKKGLLPSTTNADIFIRLSGGILMCGFSIFILYRYPNRLSVILPLFVPIWLLLASGYSEYYPFITPIYLSLLIFLADNNMKSISPLWMGVLVSSIGLLYAGFVPIAVFILFIYFLRNGFKTGSTALIYSILFAIMIIVFFWPYSFPSFIKSYIQTLNLGELNTQYLAYKGKALAYTPFFSLKYAFSLEHFRQLFFMYFWGGGISPILFIIGGLFLFSKLRHENLIKWSINGLSIGLLLGWQALYLIIKIPRLGPVTDVDLFFSVYIIFAFAVGLIFDKLAQNAQLEKRIRIQSIIISVLLGNTAFVLMHLIFLGLPIPK